VQGWNLPYNYDDGHIEYTFNLDKSASYWQAEGLFVSPSPIFRVHMELTIAEIMQIDQTFFAGNNGRDKFLMLMPSLLISEIRNLSSRLISS